MIVVGNDLVDVLGDVDHVPERLVGSPEPDRIIGTVKNPNRKMIIWVTARVEVHPSEAKSGTKKHSIWRFYEELHVRTR